MFDRFPIVYAVTVLGSVLLLPLTTQAQIDNWYRVELIIFSYPAGDTLEQWEATPDLAYPQATRFLILPGEQPGDASSAEPTTSTLTEPSGSTQVVDTSLAPPTQRTPFATLPSVEREFTSKADTMQRSGRYRILFHEAWLQPMTSQTEALPIVLDRSGDGGQWPELQGSIAVYVSGDLYLETNLWLNTQGEYLHSAWRMPPPPLGPPSMGRKVPIQTLAAGAAAPPLGQQPDSPSAGAGLTASGVTQAPAYPYRHAVVLQQTHRMRSGEVNYLDHPMLGVVAKITSMSEVERQTTAEPETEAATPPAPALKAEPPT